MITVRNKMAFISVQHVSKVFGESPGAVVALNNVSLEIEKGEEELP